MTTLQLENFESISITLNQPLAINDYIDLGLITLEANGRSFVLDGVCSTAIGSEITFLLEKELKNIEDVLFQSCAFDLLLSDLTCPELVAVAYVGGHANCEQPPWEVVRMSLLVDCEGQKIQIPIFEDV
jgi:hypothetical protein